MKSKGKLVTLCNHKAVLLGDFFLIRELCHDNDTLLYENFS
jgi:hypothetical protein